MKPLARVRELFLGPRHEDIAYTGKGTRIVFFDETAAIRAKFMGARLRAFDGREDRANIGDHVVRGMSICAGSSRGRRRTPTPFGLAPRAEIVSTDYQSVLPRGYAERIRLITERYGPVRISGHPYSCIEDRGALLEGRDCFREFSRAGSGVEHLVVAAAGHDGSLRVRFPAICESVLAVGVCEPNGRPLVYSGRADGDRKPEILIPCDRFAALRADGKPAEFSGTSAAVAVVCGAAALWAEKFDSQSPEPVREIVLRAALLASSVGSRFAPGRVLMLRESFASGRPAYSSYFTVTGASRKVLRFIVPETGIVRVAAVVQLADNGRFWLPRLPKVSIKTSSGGAPAAVAGEHWTVLDFAGKKGSVLELEIGVAEGAAGVAIVGDGLPAQAEFDELLPERRPSLPRKPFTVLGISASHEASACVMRDGVVSSAIQLERLTRIKRDGVPQLNSRMAADYCLDALGLKEKDVDAFAFNIQALIPEYYGLAQPTHSASFDLFDPFSKRAKFVSHHLAHASAAFFGSPFKKSAVFVADGSGGSTIGREDLVIGGEELREYLETRLTNSRPALHVQSTYLFDENGYKLLDRERAPSFNVRCGSSSLGETYASVSNYVFGSWQASGKLMGLAPYGSAERCGPSFLERDAQGRLNFRPDWKNNFRGGGDISDPMLCKDLAARIQADLETALLERFARVLEISGCDRIAYAGGVALNSVANARLRRELPIRELSVFPASSDAGIAIGAAAAVHFQHSGTTKRGPYQDDFLGHSYGDRDIDAALGSMASEIAVQKASVDEIAEMLADGAVIGLFDGASEFGPRALGHRSILADPRDRDMWLFINRNIKFREDFRPFAPIVPLEDAARFFDVREPLTYMLQVVGVRPAYRDRLGAVTHVDGSARVQTVDSEVLPYVHSLLKAFGRKTGIPVLLNTSLNVRGRPIVETPMQAIEMMLATHLTGLVIGGRLIRPRGARLRALNLDSKIALVPGVTVRRSAANGKAKAELVAEYQGMNQINIEDWAFEMLVRADGLKTVRELMAESSAIFPDESAMLGWLRAVDELKFVMRVR